LMRPLPIVEADEERALLVVLRFLETRALELATPDLLDLAADVRGVDVRPIPRDVEIVPR